MYSRGRPPRRGDRVGIRPTLVIGSAFALLAVPLLLASPLGALRSMPVADPTRVAP
jgi:hypothetical protein